MINRAEAVGELHATCSTARSTRSLRVFSDGANERIDLSEIRLVNSPQLHRVPFDSMSVMNATSWNSGKLPSFQAIIEKSDMSVKGSTSALRNICRKL